MLDQEKAVLDQALSFPPKSRAAIAEKLLESLDQPDSSIDEAWAEEVEDRIKAYESGEMPAIPAEDVLAKYKKG